MLVFCKSTYQSVCLPWAARCSNKMVFHVTRLCVNNIPLLEHWPGNSPDLNIIENCWDVMKRKVAQHRPKSAADLREKLQLVWSTEITAQYCAQLAAVLKNKGYSSKY